MIELRNALLAVVGLLFIGFHRHLGEQASKRGVFLSFDSKRFLQTLFLLGGSFVLLVAFLSFLGKLPPR